MHPVTCSSLWTSAGAHQTIDKKLEKTSLVVKAKGRTATAGNIWYISLSPTSNREAKL